MNSAKAPPRFVPTLTDVVQGDPETEPASDPAPASTAAPVVRDVATVVHAAEEPLEPAEPAGWAREGMLAQRRGVVGMPASLPPLPPEVTGRFTAADDAPRPADPGPEPESAAGPVLVPPAVLASDNAPEQQVQAEAPGAVPLPETAAQAMEQFPATAVPAAGSPAAGPPAAGSPAAEPPSVSEAMDGLWEAQAQKITEEYLVHRLMQRVDLVLDQRLRDAIATVVQEQTRSIVVRLREEVESVVRQAVYEAVADELAHQARTTRQ
jgi:hypothetical protein